MSEHQVQWNKNCQSYGLLPEHWGQKFAIPNGNKLYSGLIAKTITINNYDKKYTIICEILETGGIVKMSPHFVKKYLSV